MSFPWTKSLATTFLIYFVRVPMLTVGKHLFQEEMADLTKKMLRKAQHCNAHFNASEDYWL